MLLEFLGNCNVISAGIVMLGEHGETFVEQSASRATLVSKILTVCGDFFARLLVIPYRRGAKFEEM